MGLLLLLPLTLIWSVHATPTLRGLHPDLANHYTGQGGTFTCLDGSKKIPIDRVNDNYCDCTDGTDEPGTSACYYGKFYCRNRGHEPKVLDASFVDDGVCDCCDGTDEASGCNNTCLEDSKHHREALKQSVDQYASALAKKADLVTQAAQKKQDFASKSGTIDTEVEAQKQLVQSLEAQVAQLQAEKDEQDRVKAAEQAAQEAKEAEEELLRQQQQQAQELQQQEEAAVPEAVVPEAQPDEQAAAGEAPAHEETDEERGRRIASQWTHDPEAALPEPDQEDVVPTPEGYEGEQYDEHQQHYDSDHGDMSFAHFLKIVSKFLDRIVSGIKNCFADIKNWKGLQHHHAMKKKRNLEMIRRRMAKRVAVGEDDDPHAYIDDLHTPLGQSKQALKRAQEALQALERQKEEISKYHGTQFDFGPNDLFLPLAGRCLEVRQTRWNYEACFFSQAQQWEGHQGRTNIGYWSGFENGYTEAVFANGDPCHGAPNRSLRLTLKCGLDESISNVEEPATCTYVGEMTTPAMCSDADLQALQGQLKQLEQIEQEVLAEIAAANMKKDEL